VRVLEALEEQAKTEHVPSTCQARVCLALGDLDQTFYWLDRAYNERAGDLISITGDPPFDRLRAEPRYLELLRKMNLKK